MEITPDAGHIVDSLAWVQYRLGRYQQAWESISRCLDMGLDDPTIWEHYAEIALALGKKEEARRGFENALSHDPENSADLRAKLNVLEGKE